MKARMGANLRAGQQAGLKANLKAGLRASLKAVLMLAVSLSMTPLLPSARAAAPRKPARAAAPGKRARAAAAPPGKRARVAAAPSGRPIQTAGAFDFTADEIQFAGLKGGGGRFTLIGDARLTGPGRIVVAQRMSVDVPKNASDISGAQASGSVQMILQQPDGRKLTTNAASLDYHKATEEITLEGGVRVRSDLEGRGSVEATGQRAVVQAVRHAASGGAPSQTAVLTGGVDLTLVKPDTLDQPGHFSGAAMTVDLVTGNWKLSGGPGGRTKGNVVLKGGAAGAPSGGH